jgi:hypothetical protein
VEDASQGAASAEVALDVLVDLGRGLLADPEAALDTDVLFMIDKVWRPPG